VTRLYILRRNSGGGGAERVAARFAQAFARWYDTTGLWAGSALGGQVIPGRSGPPWWRSWRYTRHIDGLSLRGPGRLVFSMEYGPDCDIYRAGDGVHRLNVLRRYGANPVWMLNPWHWLAPMLEKKCLASAKVIVANSDLVQGLIDEAYPEFAFKTTRIHNGFDPQVFFPAARSRAELRAELGLPPAGMLLLLCGNGFERKGLRHAIDLLAELAARHPELDAHLAVAGRGRRDPYLRQARQLGLAARVHLVGHVQATRPWFQAADFMVLPTRHDPFSNACLEALACGCPVLTSAENGAAEVLTPRTGFIFSGRYDGDDFSAAAEFIAAHQTPPAEVARSVAHLTMEHELAAWRELIERVLAGTTSTTPS